MTRAQTMPTNAVAVAKNRYDEACKVRDAFKIQHDRRRDLARANPSQERIARVRDAEAQLDAADLAELTARDAYRHLTRGTGNDH